MYDDLLKEEWHNLHGPMCDDCRDSDDAERSRRGLEVLEWGHAAAPIVVRPPRPNWSEAFYVRGMLQQFADDLEVGWHPDYLERLGANPPGAVARAASAPDAASRAPVGEYDDLVRPTALAPGGDSPATVDLLEQLPSERAPALLAVDAAAGGRATGQRRARSAAAE